MLVGPLAYVERRVSTSIYKSRIPLYLNAMIINTRKMEQEEGTRDAGLATLTSTARPLYCNSFGSKLVSEDV